MIPIEEFNPNHSEENKQDEMAAEKFCEEVLFT